MLISDTYELILLAINVISILCVFYTMSLIIFVTPKSMSEYRMFLFMYTLCDMNFPIMIGFCLTPRMLFPAYGCIIQGFARDIFFVIKNYFGPQTAETCIKVAVVITIWLIVNVFTSQDYCLIYRLTVVISNQKYHEIIINRKVVTITVILDTLLSLLFALPAYLFVADFKDLPALMKPFNETFVDVFDEVNDDSIIVWVQMTSSKIIVRSICVGFIVSEIVCYFTVGMILKILRQNAASFSAETYPLHRQYTILLFLQITNPLIFLIAPITASCLTAFDETLFYSKTTGKIAILYMSFYSIFNSVITLMFVTPYRKFTARYSLGLLLKLPILKKFQGAAVVHVAGIGDTSTQMTFNSHNARNIK